MSFKYDIERAYQFTKQLKKFDNILARLLEAYIFMISGNHARAEYILLEIPKKELFEYALTSDISEMPVKKQIELTLDVLKKFENELSKNQVFENLLFYFYHNSLGTLPKLMDKRFKIKQSMSWIREKSQSSQFGKGYPFIWGPVFYDHETNSHYFDFVQKSYLSRLIQGTQTSYLLFYRTIQGIKPELQKSILKHVEKLSRSDEIYEGETFYRILEDRELYRFINTHSHLNFGLIANRKRKFYQSWVRKSLHLPYAVINLYLLGDLSREHLIALLAYENARF